MILTRTDTGATLDLPDDFNWEDRAWSPVAQAAEWSLTGALLIEEAAKLAGRPMTLAAYSGPGGQGSAIQQELADSLVAWSGVEGLQMTLALRGVTYLLTWRHADGGAITLTPVLFWAPTAAEESPWYAPTLRFWILSES